MASMHGEKPKPASNRTGLAILAMLFMIVLGGWNVSSSSSKHDEQLHDMMRAVFEELHELRGLKKTTTALSAELAAIKTDTSRLATKNEIVTAIEKLSKTSTKSEETIVSAIEARQSFGSVLDELTEQKFKEVLTESSTLRLKIAELALASTQNFQQVAGALEEGSTDPSLNTTLSPQPYTYRYLSEGGSRNDEHENELHIDTTITTLKCPISKGIDDSIQTGNSDDTSSC